MGRQSVLAKNRYKHDDTSGRYALLIDGKDVSSKVLSISGGYEDENGASALTVEFTDPTFDVAFYENSMAHLYLGYGDEVEPYISGRITEPKPSRQGGIPSCRILGPFAEMANQSIGGLGRGRDRDFNGYTVEAMALEIGRLAGMPLHSVEVVGGSQVEISDAYMTAEVKLLEAQTSAITPLGFVQSDRPRYRRLVRPEPRPGGSDPVVTTYTETDYDDEDGLSVEPTNAVRFASVVVFRRDDTGAYPIWEEASVANRSPFRVPSGRVHFLPEFTGTPLQAYREANRLAVSLASQSFAFSLNVSINAELLPYSMIRCVRVEQRGRRTVEVTYSCMILRVGLSISNEEFEGSYEGVAVELSVIDRTPVVRARRGTMSAGIVVRIERGLRPSTRLMPKNDLRPSRDRKAGV